MRSLLPPRSSGSLLRLASPPTLSTMNWGANGKFTATAINHIWEEHVKKEQAAYKPKTKFTMSAREAAKVGSMTEKVGYRVGLDPVDLGGDEEVIECVNNLLAAHQIPREKYADPQTSSQEVGWFTEPFVPRNPRFFHGLNQSEATKFAELYTQKMAGDHMYKNYKSSGMKF